MTGLQLDMFAMLEADQIAEKMRDGGIPTLFAHPGRGLTARLAAYAGWMQEWSKAVGVGSAMVAKAWRLPFGASEEAPATDVCQPIVLSVDLRCFASGHHRICSCVGELIHRGFCTGCDWEADVDRLCDSWAALDALDHAHPGWRDSPVVESMRMDNAMRPQKSWVREVRAAYGDRPAGWPIITERRGLGTRAVPGRSPWGGYDVAVEHVETGAGGDAEEGR